tara:strand:+ start:476 stop:820 length:345 start_codon:yes stop_codon:yes gene_type:complete
MKRINKYRKLEGVVQIPEWYGKASEIRKIEIQAYEIYWMLRDLKGRLSFSLLRLRHAILFTKCIRLKAELRFQKRILDEHINQIEKAQQENEILREKIWKKWEQEESNNIKILK